MFASLNDRQRVPLVAITSMLVVSLVVIALTGWMLYRHNFTEHVHNLEAMVASQARLIEAVAKFDAAQDYKDEAGGARGATLRQVTEAYSRPEGFGDTGEFLIAGQVADAIEYLMDFRFPADRIEQAVLLDSDSNEAMKLAIDGDSGWIITTDYRGERVIAAFEPIEELDIGLVAKIDLREIRQPFLRAAGLAAFVALLIILVGAILVQRLTNQIVGRVHDREERLRLAGEASGTGLWDIEVQTGRTHFDAQFFAMLGYGPDELESSLDTWVDLVHPDYREYAANYYRDHIANARIDEPSLYEMEFQMRAKDGSYRWILDRARIMEWQDGKPTRIMGTHVDITDQKQAEANLEAARQAAEEANRTREESEERLRLAMESANIGMWDLNAVTGDIVLNEQYMSMLGFQQFELSHDQATWRSMLHPDDLERAVQYFSDFIERSRTDKGTVYEQEYRMRTKNGEFRWIDDRCEVVAWDGDEPLRVIGTHMDVTERKESEERLELAIESAGMGFFDRDMRTGELLLSKQSMAMLGYEHHELPHTYKAWSGLRHPDDSERALSRLDTYIEKARADRNLIYEQAYRMRHKDGSYRWILIRGRIVEWDGEQPQRWLGTHTDVTAYMEAEAAAKAAQLAVDEANRSRQESEERLRLAGESSDIGFWDFDMRNGTVIFSEHNLATLGYEHKDLPRDMDSWVAFHHPDDAEKMQRHIQDHIERARDDRDATYSQEYRVRCKDGGYRWILDRGRIIEWDGDQPVRALGTHMDIHERKENEEALHRSQQLVTGVFDNANAAIFVKDRDGVYAMVNERWAELCDVAISDTIGKTDHDLFRADLADAYAENDQRVRDTKEKLTIDELIYVEGEHKNLVSMKFPLVDPDGNVYATAGIATDVTHLKNIERELRQARETADNANRSKSDFLANMSHEIRTPMNGIMGMTELALDTDLTREQREYLQTIDSSAQSLLALIDDILDFSKIEAQKLELEPIDFDLRERLGETLDTLAARAHGKGLELAFDIDPDVPDMLIGDIHRLRQIIINLIGNALKFTEQGEVVVRVGLESESEADVVAHFEVSDTGIGIPADRLDRVFRSFEQADTSTTRQYGGTGLGLTICSRLSELMGGRIWVESTPGLGSTFHFTAQLGRSNLNKRSVERTLTRELEGLRVLVVDDNQTNRQILDKMLTNWKMRSALAEDAKRALEIIADAIAMEQPFDVIISDVHMPGMDGYEFVEVIKNESGWPDVPVIMLTSARRSEDAQRSRELGIKANLLKPAKQSRILDAVITAVGVDTVSAKHDAPEPNEKAAEQVAEALHILIAEDNEVNQKFAVRALKKAGHTSSVANNGREAVEAFGNEHFDVILMDVQMPEMDGFEATAAIREREAETGTAIPIIALTAHAMKGDKEKCFAAGMNGYVTKPIKSKTLLAEIVRVRAPSENVA